MRGRPPFRFPGPCFVGRVAEFEGSRPRRVRVGNKLVAVFREGGRFYALEDRCPHEGTRLSAGKVSDGVVKCPSHALTFDLSSGLCTRNDVFRVRRYRVVVIRDRVWVVRGRQPPPWQPPRTQTGRHREGRFYRTVTRAR